MLGIPRMLGYAMGRYRLTTHHHDHHGGGGVETRTRHVGYVFGSAKEATEWCDSVPGLTPIAQNEFWRVCPMLGIVRTMGDVGADVPAMLRKLGFTCPWWGVYVRGDFE